MFVKIAIVLTGVESSVLFLNEEEGCCLGGVRRTDFPGMEILVEELFGGFLFIWKEGVEFPNFQNEGVSEIYFMVIWSGRGNVIGSFLRECRGNL